MRWVTRAVVSMLFAVSGGLWLAAAVQRWLPACAWGRFDDRACLLAQSYHYGYRGVEPWAPIADTAQLEGLSLACLAVAVALLPWLWPPRGIRVSLAVLLPAFCIGLFAVASWTVGPSGSYAAVAAAAGAPTTALVWVLGLPAMLVVAAVTRQNGAPPRTNRWRLLVALLVGMSNPLASYFIGPMFVGYVSHDDTPWVEVVSTVFLLIASVLVWPSSRPPAHRQPASVLRAAGAAHS